MPTKQLALPLVQERPAHLHITASPYHFLNFVEQRTRMVPMLQRGRAALISSHEQPLFLIWSRVASSSGIHLTRLFSGCNSARCILECAAAL